MPKLKIAIVGAGIGGLTAALSLLRAGVDVDIFERAPELAELGAGLHLSPNGSRVLIALGLEDQLERSGTPIKLRRVHVWDSGKHWDLPDQGNASLLRYGAPYLLFHRADLQTMLADAVRTLKEDAIHLGNACVSFEQSELGVSIKLANGETVTADALVGADGIRSVIRPSLFGASNPKFTGQMRWRAMLPIERVPEALREETSTWIGPSGNVTMYPVRQGKLFNIVASAERNWPYESWTEKGTIEECLQDFVGWHPLVQQVIRNIETPYKWGLFLHETLPRWSENRVTLLGDSCHATFPALGQGANMAIEDGLVLGRSVAAFGDDIPSALRAYENARIARTTMIVNRSTETLKRRHNPDLLDPVKAEKYIGSLYAPDRVHDWYDWIYEYDATSAPLALSTTRTEERTGS